MLYKIGGVHFHLLGTNAFHVQAKDERFTAASSRCRQNLKYENFTCCLPDVKTLHPKACSTNIFLHSTNQIIDCGVVVDVAVVKSKRNFIHVTGTATTTPQIKNLIGRVSENKRAARTYVQVRAILCKTTT